MSIGGMLGKKFALKGLIDATGNAVSGAFGVLSKTGSALSSAAGQLSSAASAANQIPDDKPTEQTITGSVGIAGTAGKQKIGKGKINRTRNVSKPVVSEKMPTEKLLNVVVKYLYSIDKTLKNQLQLDMRTVEDQNKADREAQIEGKKTSLKEGLVSFKGAVKENVSTAKKVAMIIGGIALAAGLISTTLDSEQLKEFKENIERFKTAFGWLAGLASIIPAGGLAGFLFGARGLKGRFIAGLVGIVAELVFKLFNPFSDNKGDGKGLFGTNLSLSEYGQLGLGVGALGYMGYRGFKSRQAAKIAAAAAANAPKTVPMPAATPQASPAYAAKGFTAAEEASFKANKAKGLSSQEAYRRMRLEIPRGSYKILAEKELQILQEIEKKEAEQLAKNARNLNFFKSAKWKRFLAYLRRKGLLSDAAELEKKAEQSLKTGGKKVPKVPKAGLWGAALTIMMLLLENSDQIMRLAREYLNFSDQDQEPVNAQRVMYNRENAAFSEAPSLSQKEVDALSKLEAIPANVKKILETIKTIESNGNYAALNPTSSASGAYQFIDSTWQAQAKAAGIGTEYPRAYLAPPEVQDAVAAHYVQQLIKKTGGDVRKIAAAWLTGNPEGRTTAKTPGEVAAYQNKFASTYTGGKFAESTYTPENGMGFNAAAEMFGKLSSLFIQPGVPRDDLFPKPSNVSAQINSDSMKLQNDMAFGNSIKKNKETIEQAITPGVTPTVRGPKKSISPVDPNYIPNLTIGKFLAHFVDAA